MTQVGAPTAAAQFSATSSRAWPASARRSGYLFPVGDRVQGALSVKAYWEFAARNRPAGWNLWAGIALSPAPPKKTE